MTPEQYRAALKALGLTQAGAARLLGVDARTSRHWAKGDRTIPGPVARFLSFLIAAGVSADEVFDALAKQ